MGTDGANVEEKNARRWKAERECWTGESGRGKIGMSEKGKWRLDSGKWTGSYANWRRLAGTRKGHTTYVRNTTVHY